MTTPPTRAEMRELLLAGGRANGSLNDQAAMHLLTFTEIPDAPRFAEHAEVTHIRTFDGLVKAAVVRDWDQLIDDPQLYPSGGELKFLKLAASFAAGRPVSLFDEISRGLDLQHVRRLAEAVLIAAGAAEVLSVGPARAGDRRQPA